MPENKGEVENNGGVEDNEEYEGMTSEQYEYEMEQIELMFPDAKFSISIGLEELDDVITEQPHIVIKHAHKCYCYDEAPKQTEFYYISGDRITNKLVIEKLIEQGLELDCNHGFLEGFHKPRYSDVQFEIVTGS